TPHHRTDAPPYRPGSLHPRHRRVVPARAALVQLPRPGGRRHARTRRGRPVAGGLAGRRRVRDGAGPGLGTGQPPAAQLPQPVPARGPADRDRGAVRGGTGGHPGHPGTPRLGAAAAGGVAGVVPPGVARVHGRVRRSRRRHRPRQAEGDTDASGRSGRTAGSHPHAPLRGRGRGHGLAGRGVRVRGAHPLAGRRRVAGSRRDGRRRRADHDRRWPARVRVTAPAPGTLPGRGGVGTGALGHQRRARARARRGRPLRAGEAGRRADPLAAGGQAVRARLPGRGPGGPPLDVPDPGRRVGRRAPTAPGRAGTTIVERHPASSTRCRQSSTTPYSRGLSHPGAERRNTPGSPSPTPSGTAPARSPASWARLVTWTCRGRAGQAPNTTYDVTARRRSASWVSAVWLSVPSPARATTIAVASTVNARSATVQDWPDGRTPIGTSSPPAPSMSTRSYSLACARTSSTTS